MGIRMVELPECDKCGAIWLPDKRLPDGSPNPARENPRLCKRCGKCKTPTWNYKETAVHRAAKKLIVKDNTEFVEEWLG